MAQMVKNLPAMQETQVQSLGREDPLEKEMAPLQHSCLENPMDGGAWWATVHGSQRVGGHDLATSLSLSSLHTWNVVIIIGFMFFSVNSDLCVSLD